MHQPLVLPLFSPFGVNSVLVSVCVCGGVQVGKPEEEWLECGSADSFPEPSVYLTQPHHSESHLPPEPEVSAVAPRGIRSCRG